LKKVIGGTETAVSSKRLKSSSERCQGGDRVFHLYGGNAAKAKKKKTCLDIDAATGDKKKETERKRWGGRAPKCG